ncbi:type IIA DNA topoisomerase subunit B [Oceanispirochaeta crateris]|uniref:DNA topoisomerase (ATP-hydrolyzing) n=1 Tax=Oceanispirochaeta crateris TaxID=2518645 RepID=A0A5C1QJS5_9SPIO|nr:DNA topoisomerase IV subunit B [Oceanispirochaeta crateris]QEN07841.1 type IIA DNA topoisomerase subunit B [Oceanispirochaeta crateris]
MSAKKTSYDESKIKTLSSLEHIRLRSGMYIGRLGNGNNPDDGIYILIKEVVDNAIDEFIMGYGNRIDISLQDHKVQVRDHGRGIPLGKIVECVSIINTGAKYNDDVFQFSVGLNGVGTKAVNALSSYFLVRAYRDGKFAEAIFERGNLVSQKKGNAPEVADGTFVEFIPDTEIFGEYNFTEEFLEQRCWNYACLNKGLRIYFNKQKFESKRGLWDLLHSEVGDDIIYDIGYHQSEKIEFAFTHNHVYGESYFSFVNGQYTSDGGTHLSAFREGLLKGVNDFFKKNYSGQDVREGMAGAIAVKIKDPVFESQTKNKLGNSDIRSWIVNETKAGIVDFLHKNSDAASAMENKIINNEKFRKELNAVKKEAKAAAKKISLNIPKLKDCKYHRPDGDKGRDSTIFITEGQSATGSMVSCRDVYLQAIYSLRGKPWNTYGKKQADIYRNEELYNLMMALGIENSIDDLRYDKIVVATDADNDGFHIRNLLLTFFLNYFEELVQAGHMYILETPLFRVRNKKQTIYCYNEAERDKAMESLRGNEVTRFKGLGEISPNEFGQFIGEDMRIVPVNIKSMKETSGILEFYMGKNTPDRRKYIMENLV